LSHVTLPEQFADLADGTLLTAIEDGDSIADVFDVG
jgi:hypothetical protein